MRNIGLPELLVIFGLIFVVAVVVIAVLAARRPSGNGTRAGGLPATGLASKICPHCGQRIPDLGSFCPICGERVTGAPAAPRSADRG